MAQKTIVVTGAAGFIGRRLGAALRQQGWRVRSLDISDAEPGDWADEAVHGDICDAPVVDRTLAGAAGVVHLAAKHRFFGVATEEFQRVNVEGTRTLAEGCRRAGIDDFLFYSSVAVYGDSPGPTTEETDCRAVLPYGVTKREAERLLTSWAGEDQNRRLIIVRPTVVFGPRNRGNVYRLMRQVDWRIYLQIGRGENVKSVAFLDNLVAATLFLMAQRGVGVTVCNYADEPHIRFKDFVTSVHRVLGRAAPRVALPVGPVAAAAAPIEAAARLFGRDLPVRAAITKMNKTTHHSAAKLRGLGFRQPFTTDEGLTQMAAWFRQSRGADVKGEYHE